jgi:Spy/CpxP family protein refolding chaperone
MAKVVVILGFCLSFAAGLVIGWRAHKPGSPIAATISDLTGGGHPHSTTQPGNGPRRGSTGWWQSELGLTADQRTKMDHIWSSLASKARNERDERRREYRRERDTSIADLVPASQLGEYDRIIDTYNERIAGLDRESRDAYETAVEETKQILTADQRTRYEDLLKKYHWGPPQVRDRHPSTRRSETRPGANEAAPAAAHLSSTSSSPSSSPSSSSSSLPTSSSSLPSSSSSDATR